MPRISPALMLFLSAIAVPPCVGQRPALTGDHLPVEILTVEAGEQAPRLPEQKGDAERAGARPFTLAGRKVAWRVGSRRIEERPALLDELERLRADESGWREDPSQPGMRTPLPLLLKPDAEARWDDVVRAIDVAVEAGFADIHCAEAGAVSIWLIGKAVADPVRDGGGHVVPEALYSEPDEEPDGSWRPEIHVGQDGRVAYEGETVFDPKADSGESASLEAFLDELGDTAREKLGSREVGPDGREFVHARVLIHADKWARWRDVQRILQLATRAEPAFWKFEYAVGDYDFEARIRAGERF